MWNVSEGSTINLLAEHPSVIDANITGTGVILLNGPFFTNYISVVGMIISYTTLALHFML